MSSSALSPSAMLASSMHAQPGVYAVLLGSGVSTGAGVLTGWGVVKELVRRLAIADSPEDQERISLATDDPEAWWEECGDGTLGYATLLEILGRTQAARQGLLADFFEPTDEDRDDGIKVPSRAHHAVAQLVKKGLIRVVLTTNFDRLMEQALEAAGVSPQVIARPEAVDGMAPLAHANATVIKLHGDYKDLGTRNTPEELRIYPEQWTTLLAQVFDEYGLIISGWSADWDTALVAALDSSPNRRYPLYWDSRSSKGETAQRLLSNRRGLVLPSAGADELFGGLVASIEALESLSQPPLTTAMAVARLKRALPDPVRRIELHDLIMGTANEVAAQIAEQPLSISGLDGGMIQRTFESHLETATPLIHLLVTGVWHDSDGVHEQLWLDALQRLIDAGTFPVSSANTLLDTARRWPALFAMFAMGTAAVRRNRERLIIRLSTEPKGRLRFGTSDPMEAAQLLHPIRLLEKQWIDVMPRWGEGHPGWIHPASHVLKADLRRFFGDLIPLDDDYVTAFHGFEYRLGLIQEKCEGTLSYRALSGEYIGEDQWGGDNYGVPLAEFSFRESAARVREWPWPDYLGRDNFDQALIDHRDVLKRLRSSQW